MGGGARVVAGEDRETDRVDASAAPRGATKYPRLGHLLRAAAANVASGEGTIASGPAAGLRIDATGRNAGYILGTADFDEQRWLSENLRRGDVFWDLGANIGFFTLLAARLVGEPGEVVAFEPWPDNARQLRRNVELNGFRNVIIEESAVGANTGSQAFAMPAPGRRDAARLVDDTRPGSLVVQVTTIDDYAARRPRTPTVVKIDIEGAEIEALSGAMGLIGSARPIFLVEVHWLGGDFVDFFLGQLAPLGYEPFRLSGEAVTLLPREPERFHLILRARSGHLE
jgi:FkbM family methyltransferase